MTSVFLYSRLVASHRFKNLSLYCWDYLPAFFYILWFQTSVSYLFRDKRKKVMKQERRWQISLVPDNSFICSSVFNQSSGLLLAVKKKKKVIWAIRVKNLHSIPTVLPEFWSGNSCVQLSLICYVVEGINCLPPFFPPKLGVSWKALTILPVHICTEPADIYYVREGRSKSLGLPNYMEAIWNREEKIAQRNASEMLTEIKGFYVAFTEDQIPLQKSAA